MEIEKLLNKAKIGDEESIKKLIKDYPETYEYFIKEKELNKKAKQERIEMELKEKELEEIKKQEEIKNKLDEEEKKKIQEEEVKKKEEERIKEILNTVKELMSNTKDNNVLGDVYKQYDEIKHESVPELVTGQNTRYNPPRPFQYTIYNERAYIDSHTDISSKGVTKREFLIRNMLNDYPYGVKFNPSNDSKEIKQAMINDIMKSELDEFKRNDYVFICKIGEKKHYISCNKKIAETMELKESSCCEIKSLEQILDKNRLLIKDVLAGNINIDEAIEMNHVEKNESSQKNIEIDKTKEMKNTGNKKISLATIKELIIEKFRCKGNSR